MTAMKTIGLEPKVIGDVQVSKPIQPEGMMWRILSPEEVQKLCELVRERSGDDSWLNELRARCRR